MDLWPDICLLAGIVFVLLVLAVNRLVSRYLRWHFDRAEVAMGPAPSNVVVLAARREGSNVRPLPYRRWPA